jgi:ATP adenylyltransferase
MPEILWAPWRLSYVEKPSTGKSTDGDIFLDLPAENEDRKNLILYRGQEAFVIMNAFPYTTGHLLVAPLRQVADVVDLTDSELLEINRLVAKCVSWAREAFKPDGFNIGVNLGRASGAGIPQHIHWHVVPRWNGDTNFMTSIGDVRVMPQSLDDGYERLAKIVAGGEQHAL